jgi:RimJ/RimL family protein N-acetyltransferase
MSSDEYNSYIDDSLTRYITDLNYDAEGFTKLTGKQPEEFATAQFKEFIPHGQHTPNQRFMKVIETETKEIVGDIWFVYREDKNISFIGDVFFEEVHRGKGYGSEALKMLEKIAKEDHKTNSIVLSVFKHNPRAKSFYERNGYEVISQSPLNYDMMKKLS